MFILRMFLCNLVIYNVFIPLRNCSIRFMKLNIHLNVINRIQVYGLEIVHIKLCYPKDYFFYQFLNESILKFTFEILKIY